MALQFAMEPVAQQHQALDSSLNTSSNINDSQFHTAARMMPHTTGVSGDGEQGFIQERRLGIERRPCCQASTNEQNQDRPPFAQKMQSLGASFGHLHVFSDDEDDVSAPKAEGDRCPLQ